MGVLPLICSGLAGYLLGSIPFGLIVCRSKGLDPRKKGSRNIGASNVTRTAGKLLGLLTLLCDLSKSAAAVLLSVVLFRELWAAVLAGFCSVLGHCFPIWLKGRGGKGVASAFGCFAALLPEVALSGGIVWLVLFMACRIPAIASLIALLWMAVQTAIEREPLPILLFSFLIFLLSLGRHRSNLRALFQSRAFRRWFEGRGRVQRGEGGQRRSR